MSRRTIATVWLPGLSSAALFLFLISIRDRLPARVATHWGAGGMADGFADADTLPYVAVAFTLGIAWLLAALTTVTRRAVVGGGFDSGLPLGMVWFLGSLTAILTALQIDSTEPPDLAGWSIPLAMGIGVAGWLIGVLVAGRRAEVSKTRAPALAGAPRLEIPEGSTAVWSDKTPHAAFMPYLATGVVFLGLGIGWLASWWVTLIFVPIVVLLIGSTTYRVTAGPRHIEARGLLFGFPRVRVPLDEVAAVEAGTVSAVDFGGWGVRVNLDGESAVVTRSGPALVVQRSDGAVLRISLEQPDKAVPVISTLLDRRT